MILKLHEKEKKKVLACGGVGMSLSDKIRINLLAQYDVEDRAVFVHYIHEGLTVAERFKIYWSIS